MIENWVASIKSLRNTAVANQKPFPASLLSKSGALKPRLIGRDMEADQTFQLYLLKYQGIRFHHVYDAFSNHCQRLATPEIIDLHTETEKRIVELLTKVLPHHPPLEIPCFRAFASFEPSDVSSDYLEQEAAKEKGAFIQAL
ncbi:hypothetical protein TNCV_1905561 [Trichonephila clavipes]|nr:hypothetical protein TNCV_1905561 [Trichonephila clavipes]